MGLHRSSLGILILSLSHTRAAATYESISNAFFETNACSISRIQPVAILPMLGSSDKIILDEIKDACKRLAIVPAIEKKNMA